MNKKTAKTVKNAKKVINKNKKPLIIGGICAGAAVVVGVIAKGIKGMKQSAKAQHEVDKANFAAAKSEAKANFAEARAKSNISTNQQMLQEERDTRIAEANKRKAEADARYDAAKVNK